MSGMGGHCTGQLFPLTVFNHSLFVASPIRVNSQNRKLGQYTMFVLCVHRLLSGHIPYTSVPNFPIALPLSGIWANMLPPCTKQLSILSFLEQV